MRPVKFFTVLIVAFALLLMLYRGPLRALYRGGGGDFATPYVAALRLLQHRDPYLCCGTFGSDWVGRGGSMDNLPDISGQHPVYPPTSLTVLLPFALLRWRAALLIEVLLTTIGLLTVIAVYAWKLHLQGSIRLIPFFLALTLLLSPLHTGIALGNLGILSFVIAAVALFVASRYEASAGALLALAICMKPNVAMPVLLFLLFKKHWRPLLSCIFCCVGVLTFSAAELSLVNPSWRNQYRENINFLVGPNGDASYVPRYADMLNLQNPLFAAMHSRLGAELGAWIITSFLLVLWVRYGRATSDEPAALASVSCFWLIGLLPIYQRGYNAGALVLVVAWAFMSLAHLQARLTLWLIPVFILPGFTVIYVHSLTGDPNTFELSGIFKAFVLCHQTWTIVAIALLQLSYLRRRARESLGDPKFEDPAQAS
jgi:hypothetical protein